MHTWINYLDILWIFFRCKNKPKTVWTNPVNKKIDFDQRYGESSLKINEKKKTTKIFVEIRK